MIDDDEYLERIVAGIQAVTTSGAEVTWDEKIGGRQFDVVVRFKLGTLRYLVLVEVRNRTRRASASDMDAFVLKASDQNANKMVFVTAAGFQEGAITVAKRHGVDLFTVTFDENEMSVPKEGTFISLRKKNAPRDALPELTFSEPQLTAAIETITLVYHDGSEAELPDEQSQMTYYCVRTKFADGRQLGALLNTAPFNVEADKTTKEVLRLEPPEAIHPPDTFFIKPGTVIAVKFTVIGRMGRVMRGNIKVDPGVFTTPIVYTNVLTGEASRFSIDQLPLGVERVSVGKFYFNYHPLAYYYCDAVKDDEITWYMVESFQAGQLFQVVTRQHTKYSTYYIEVTDKKILTRLQARLERMKSHRGNKAQ